MTGYEELARRRAVPGRCAVRLLTVRRALREPTARNITPAPGSDRRRYGLRPVPPFCVRNFFVREGGVGG